MEKKGFQKGFGGSMTGCITLVWHKAVDFHPKDAQRQEKSRRDIGKEVGEMFEGRGQKVFRTKDKS